MDFVSQLLNTREEWAADAERLVNYATEAINSIYKTNPEQTSRYGNLEFEEKVKLLVVDDEERWKQFQLKVSQKGHLTHLGVLELLRDYVTDIESEVEQKEKDEEQRRINEKKNFEKSATFTNYVNEAVRNAVNGGWRDVLSSAASTSRRASAIPERRKPAQRTQPRRMSAIKA